LFLRTVRLLFAEETVSAVFLPALADFQDEVRQVSSGRQSQLSVRWRWYWALTALVVLLPLPLASLRIADRRVLRRTTSGRWLFRLLVVSLFGGTCGWLFVMAPRCCQEFSVVTLFGGMVLAYAMRTWNDCHAAGCGISVRVAAFPMTP
jgi:hypothetical protein